VAINHQRCRAVAVWESTFLPGHTTPVTKYILDGDCFRVFIGGHHEVIRQKFRDSALPLDIRIIDIVVDEKCNGCSSQGLRSRRNVKECVHSCGGSIEALP